MNTIESLTHQLIDYAGLFPPAGLPMSDVVQNYAGYVAGEKRQMLSRLIIPAARLAEFEQLAEGILPVATNSQPWRISALVPSVSKDESSDFKYAISGIAQFNKRHDEPEKGLAVVDVIEIKTPTLAHLTQTMLELPDDLQAFMEIPHQDDPTELVKSIADNNDGRFFAKIRTGGVTPELIPDSAKVAKFLHACAENLVGLKATAGLHHPLRNQFNLTYEDDSPTATMHGFINMFAAVCFAFGCSVSADEIEAILSETSADEFSFTDQSLCWKDHKISSTKIAAIRRKFAISFGSCSFTEPTTELEEVGFTSPPMKSV